MSSCGLDGAMNTTHASLSLFTRDLETTFHGTAGIRLLQELDDLGLSTLGASRPLDLATRLQTAGPETDEALTQLVRLAQGDPRLTSLVVVALAPEITAAITRSGGQWLTRERFGDLYLGARATLAEGDFTIRTALANRIVSLARHESRQQDRSRRRVESLPEDFDVPEEIVEEDPRLELLLVAEQQHVVSHEDFRLVVDTRTRGSSLAAAAENLGITYDAARLRRSRAEAKLRNFVTQELQR